METEFKTLAEAGMLILAIVFAITGVVARESAWKAKSSQQINSQDEQLEAYCRESDRQFNELKQELKDIGKIIRSEVIDLTKLIQREHMENNARMERIESRIANHVENWQIHNVPWNGIDRRSDGS